MPLDPQGGCGCKWYDVIGSRCESPNKLIPWCELIGAYTHPTDLPERVSITATLIDSSGSPEAVRLVPGPLRAIPRGYPRRLWAPPRRHCPAPLGVRSPILPYWLYFHTPLYRITSHSFIYKSCCSCCLRAPFELIKLARAGIYKLLRSSACWVPSAIHTTGESSSHLDGQSTAPP